jgi:hypothetical protein
MPKMRKSDGPANPKPARMPTATMQAVRAVRNRPGTDSRAVMVRNAGTAAIGSIMINNEPNEKSAYSNKDTGLSLPLTIYHGKFL